MPAFRDLSIRYKLTLLLLGVVAVVLLAVSAANVISGIQSTRAAMQAKYSALAKIVAAQGAPALAVADVDASGAQQVVDDLQVEPTILYAALYNGADELIAAHPQSGPAAPPLPGRLGAQFTGDGFLDVVDEVEAADGTPLGKIYLRATTAELRDQIRRTILIALAVFALALALAFLLSYALQRFISAPILELADVAERVRTGHDYSLRVPQQSRDELGTLAGGFNDMLAVIERRDRELDESRLNLEDQVEQRTEQLQQSIERTRRIVDTAGDAFVAMDAQGRIVDWNPQAEALFGYSRIEALGRLVADTVVPDALRDAHRQGLAKFLETGEGPVFNQRIEVPALSRNGGTFPVELTITPIRDGDSFLFAAFLHDISARKQAEADLKQAKEAAEAATKAKSEFLANMSHEIRTPMNGIIGMSELLAGTPLRGDQAEFLGLIQQSAQSLLKLINDILDFSKIEAGKLELEAIEFSLQDCAAKAVRLLAVRAAEKGLELACRIDPAIPDRLVGDPGRVRQVIVNLVGNAIKFTEQGEVVVEITPDSVADGHVYLQASVRDTGVGIPLDKQQQLFQAFTQADASTTRKYGGTGLGLTISQRLIHLMGGRIWIESQPDQGTTFHFTLRLGLAADQAPRRPAALDELRGLPVLVVDDNSTNRLILGELLKNWQLRPLLASSGAAALEVIEQASKEGLVIKLVLLDYHMPGMDGVQFAQRLKALPDWQPCPMILLSSSVGGLDSERLKAAGINRFMPKPVIASELLPAMLDQLGVATRHTGPSDDFPRLAPRRILLAEDNAVNQRVMLGFLNKWGHETVVATSGREAVQAVERQTATCQPFDLVLMDVQMPEMDGYEATAAIRLLEKGTSRRLPIIALTAEAMKGDRERCLEAGMDDYLSKPIDTAALHARIAACPASVPAKVDSSAVATKPATPAPEAVALPASDGVIDWDLARRYAGGDEALLRDLVEVARQQGPDLVAAARQAFAAGDIATLRRSAHTLKSTCNYFGAQKVGSVAHRLESMARDNQLAGAPAAIDELDREVVQFVAALQAWDGSPDPSMLS